MLALRHPPLGKRPPPLALVSTDSVISLRSDSNGGDYFLPAETEAENHWNNARFSSQSSAFRRHNLSINIGSLPVPFRNVHLSSPTSLASSGAPYTDSFSLHNVHLGQDYFQFDEASLSSATGSDQESTQQQIPNQLGYRLPASQPTSPVAGLYHHGQPSAFVPIRQRGATFSGSYPSYGETQGLFPASALPVHFGFTHTHSPIHSPITPSSHITVSPVHTHADRGYFGEMSLGMSDVLMEDVSTPTPTMPPALSRASSFRETSKNPSDMSGMDKLSLLEA